MKNKKIYYWVCDKSENSGEGQLALFFLKNLRKKYKTTEIKKPKIKNQFLSKILNYKYIIPFLGVLYCWKFFFYKKKIYYINYLPLWNFALFLLLPPNSNIGPITGGAKFSGNLNFIRKFLFPIFYKISEIIIIFRKFNLVFSTDLLKKYLYKRTIKKSTFNFIISNFKFSNKKTKDKNLDFLIYYRNHPNKKKFFPVYLIKNLVKLGFSVNVVGNKLNITNIINHGFLNKKKLIKLQKRARYTIFSEENLYSIFTLECIKNNVLILIDKSNNSKLTFFKKRFVKIDYQNLKELRKLNYLYKNRL